jgi:hypothetical protein
MSLYRDFPSTVVFDCSYQMSAQPPAQVQQQAQCASASVATAPEWHTSEKPTAPSAVSSGAAAAADSGSGSVSGVPRLGTEREPGSSGAPAPINAAKPSGADASHSLPSQGDKTIPAAPQNSPVAPSSVPPTATDSGSAKPKGARAYEPVGKEQPGPRGYTLVQSIKFSKRNPTFCVQSGDLVRMKKTRNVVPVACVGYQLHGRHKQCHVATVSVDCNNQPFIRWPAASAVAEPAGRADELQEKVIDIAWEAETKETKKVLSVVLLCLTVATGGRWRHRSAETARHFRPRDDSIL